MAPAPARVRLYHPYPFTGLLAVLLLAIGGHGIVAALMPGPDPLEWLVGISLVAVVLSAPHGTLRWLLGVLAMGCVAARLVHGLLDHPLSAAVGQSLVAAVALLAAGVAVHRALASGPVDVERIAAALDAYLLAGVAFGVVYWMMEAAWPGSFASSAGAALTPQRAIYFSFVTQATVGFGDIVPAGEPAEGLVVVQGIGG